MGQDQRVEISRDQQHILDHYERHQTPKKIWVRELVKNACGKLRAAQRPPAWVKVEAAVGPKCTAKKEQIRSLMEAVRAEIPEFRQAQSLAYPMPEMICLMVMAAAQGVVRGPDYVDTLSRGHWVIEGRRHHCLDTTLGEDRSRVRSPKAARALGTLRRVLVSLANAAVDQARKLQPKTKCTPRTFQQRFRSARAGRQRLQVLIFSKSPNVLDL